MQQVANDKDFYIIKEGTNTEEEGTKAKS